MKIENNESKKRFSLYTYEATINKAKDFANKRNCGTSDFIAEAIEFYSGFLSNQNDTSFLPDAVADSMTKVMDPFTRKQGTLLFKIAVELTVLQNIIAANTQIDEATLQRVRGICVNEVKKLNGMITFDEAVRWQE